MPLYPSAPAAALRNPALYENLALFDALRMGNARERNLAAEIFERLKQPAVAGEILAGVVIGPSVLHLVEPTEITNTLAEMGVIFLLFLVGLQTKPADIFRVGARALLVASRLDRP